jgi:hypothetical protein
MRAVVARRLRREATEVMMHAGAARGEYARAWRRLYRRMKRDYTRREGGFRGR